MKRISIIITGLTLFVSAGVMAQSHKQQPASALDKKVDDLIAKMTLEGKVGQMTEVTLDVVSKSNTSRRSPGRQAVVPRKPPRRNVSR